MHTKSVKSACFLHKMAISPSSLYSGGQKLSSEAMSCVKCTIPLRTVDLFVHFTHVTIYGHSNFSTWYQNDHIPISNMNYFVFNPSLLPHDLIVYDTHIIFLPINTLLEGFFKIIFFFKNTQIFLLKWL